VAGNRGQARFWLEWDTTALDATFLSSRPKRGGEPALSEVEGDLLFLFCPSDLTAANKSHRPPLCHPERTRISYLTAQPAVTYAALRKESRMKSTEATVFDRKSGGAEGPAVRPGSRTKVSVPLVPPQNRHPACPGLPWERSAPQIDRVTQRLWRGVEEPVLSVVEGTSAAPIYPMLLGAFRPLQPDHRICFSGTIVVVPRRATYSRGERSKLRQTL
jgi:hypothetical protein